MNQVIGDLDGCFQLVQLATHQRRHVPTQRRRRIGVILGYFLHENAAKIRNEDIVNLGQSIEELLQISTKDLLCRQ